MPNSQDQLKLDLPSGCKAHELFPDQISKAEAQAVTKPCKNSPINVVSCQLENHADFVAEANGLDLGTINALPSMDPAELARFIPNTHRKIFDLPASSLPFTQVGVSLKDLFVSLPSLRSGHLRWSNLRMREDLPKENIFQGKERILFLSGRDLLIESVSQEEERINFYKTLAKMDFRLVSSFNFSVFFGECALDHHLNIKRSAESLRLLQKAGIAAVPHFYWANEFHSKKILNLIISQPNIRIISVNCQCYHKVDYPTVATGLRFIANNTNGRVHFLLEGPARAFLETIKDLAPLVHVAIKSPVMETINHTRLNFFGDTRIKTRSSLSLEALLAHNTKAYEEYLQNNFWNPVATENKFMKRMRAANKIKQNSRNF